VLRSSEDREVVGIVVEGVAVNVVDDLVRRKLSALALLNDVTMLGDALPALADEAVAVLNPALTANDSTVVTTQPGSPRAILR
jgi:hypothetical protein